MRHDGKRMLQLYVPPATLDLIRAEAKARKTTMSEFVEKAVAEKIAREKHGPMFATKASSSC